MVIPRRFDGQGLRMTPNRGGAVLRQTRVPTTIPQMLKVNIFISRYTTRPGLNVTSEFVLRLMILLQVTGEIAAHPGSQCVFYKYHESQPYAL